MSWTLEEAITLPDPAWAWSFRVLELRLFNPSSALARQGGMSGDSGGSLVDLRYVQGVSIPMPFLESNGISREATKLYFPGFEDVNSATFTFYEDSNYTVHKMLHKWRRLIRSDKGLYSLPVTYKGTALVALYPAILSSERGASARPTPSLKLRLNGLFPTTQPPTDVNYESNNRVTVPMEFSVDDAYPED